MIYIVIVRQAVRAPVSHQLHALVRQFSRVIAPTECVCCHCVPPGRYNAQGIYCHRSLQGGRFRTCALFRAAALGRVAQAVQVDNPAHEELDISTASFQPALSLSLSLSLSPPFSLSLGLWERHLAPTGEDNP